ncbi:MAG: DUF1127 domain-containing protein [Pseudomonadota bacterium]
MSQFENATRHSPLERWISRAKVRELFVTVFDWLRDVRSDYSAISELSRMSDHELADIGLSRSDLTLDGLAVAGAKRAISQEAISKEKSTGRRPTEAKQHGTHY